MLLDIGVLDARRALRRALRRPWLTMKVDQATNGA